MRPRDFCTQRQKGGRAERNGAVEASAQFTASVGRGAARKGEAQAGAGHVCRKPLSADLEEQAADLENQEALEAIENSEIREIHQIQEALKRISEGTYGICAHCGEDIDPKHLEALPTATRCISCAA